MDKNTGRASAAASSTLLRRMNERKVIDALATGACSRADLTRRTGISAPTVSKAIRSLVALGLVEKRDTHENTSGRPAHIYALADDSVHVIGVTLGPHSCEIRSNGVDCRDEPESTDAWPTPDDTEPLIQSIAERILKIDDSTEKRLLGVGVIVPGAVDQFTGTVIESPAIPQLDRCELQSALAQRTGAVVQVVAQATGLCLAEQWFARARDYAHVVVIDLHDDLSLRCCMGGNTMMSPDGRCGALGRLPAQPPANEPRKPGVYLGDIATDAAFAAAVSGVVGRSIPSDEAARLVADDHDAKLHAVLEPIAAQLAHATVVIKRLFSPQAIFFHGDLLDADAGLLDRVAEGARKSCPIPPLHRSSARLSHAGIATIVDRLAAGADG